MQVVIVRILCHASIEECPCEIIDSVLFVLYRLRDDLRVEMVVHTVVEMRLEQEDANKPRELSAVIAVLLLHFSDKNITIRKFSQLHLSCR